MENAVAVLESGRLLKQRDQLQRKKGPSFGVILILVLTLTETLECDVKNGLYGSVGARNPLPLYLLICFKRLFSYSLTHYFIKSGATAVSTPPPSPFFFNFIFDYDREFYADLENYKTMSLKISRKCCNLSLKVQIIPLKR